MDHAPWNFQKLAEAFWPGGLTLVVRSLEPRPPQSYGEHRQSGTALAEEPGRRAIDRRVRRPYHRHQRQHFRLSRVRQYRSTDEQLGCACLWFSMPGKPAWACRRPSLACRTKSGKCCARVRFPFRRSKRSWRERQPGKEPRLVSPHGSRVCPPHPEVFCRYNNRKTSERPIWNCTAG